MALLTILAFIVACATAGKKIDVDAIKNNVKLGVTTKAQLLQLCGEPVTAEYDAKNEMDIMHYAYIEKNITGAGVITHIVGIGDEWESKRTLVDIFIKNGIVIDMKIDTASSVKLHYK